MTVRYFEGQPKTSRNSHQTVTRTSQYIWDNTSKFCKKLSKMIRLLWTLHKQYVYVIFSKELFYYVNFKTFPPQQFYLDIHTHVHTRLDTWGLIHIPSSEQFSARSLLGHEGETDALPKIQSPFTDSAESGYKQLSPDTWREARGIPATRANLLKSSLTASGWLVVPACKLQRT